MKEAIKQEVGDEKFALVVKQDVAVTNYVDQVSTGNVESMSGSNGYNVDGSIAGSDYAKTVNLSGNAVNGNGTAPKQLK